jgi:hypothetical protein
MIETEEPTIDERIFIVVYTVRIHLFPDEVVPAEEIL